MQAFDFTGKTVFVAGGTSGINLGIAEAFAKAGAKLAVVSRSQNRVDEAQRQLRLYNGEVVGLSADVRNVEAISAALKTAHDSLGEIDILVSGAAGNFPSPALGMSANGFKAVIDIDLLGTFNVLRTAHTYLRKPGAVIVNISAPQALLPTPEAMQSIIGGVPLGRAGTKQDVANLVLFLASPWATYISGAVIPVDGGWSANGARGV